ncbi:MAG: lipoyl(octanoyl) transferase LipB [Pseudomonadota bacterium]
MGVKVSVVEMISRILPYEDSEMASKLETMLKQEGIEIYTNTTVKAINEKGSTKVVTFGEKEAGVDLVLVALGRMERKTAWVLQLDILPYDKALRLQEELVSKRREGNIRDLLILLEHPPVVTVTREKTRENIIVPLDKVAKEGIAIAKTNRGGDVTYHGPGQLVGYLIMDLNHYGNDLHKYVHNIETIIINLLKDYNITAYRDSHYPGVWVNDEKIAAIGIAVKPKWIAMHGFSLNVNPNLDHFSLIFPCGIRNKKVTSLTKVLGKAVDKKELCQRLICHFSNVFNLKTEEIPLEDMVW